MKKNTFKHRGEAKKAVRFEKIPPTAIRSFSKTKVPGPEQQHTIMGMSRWIDAGAVYPQATMTPTSWSFKLSSIPGSAEIIAMWDFWRITRVEACYFPASHAGPTTATTSNAACVMAVCVDFDESTAVTYDKLLERQNTQIYSSLDEWIVEFEPRLSSVVYGNGVTNAYTLAPRGTWVDTASDASYYGLNFAFPATPATMQFGGRVCYRVQLEFSKLI